ncbi:VENN motif pre-toxin domain-containing protein [Orbaceae bacterium ESL0721]|nr:VENN motif pre-toxin domain-containing protein [Orbaceae bacterium ESL0721]
MTESEKENISALTQLALGIATATATGGDMDAAGAAVQAGKNSIENNDLGLGMGNVLGFSDTTSQAYESIGYGNSAYITQEEAIQIAADISNGKGMDNGSDYAFNWAIQTPAIAASFLVSGVEGVFVIASLGGGTNAVYQVSSKPLSEYEPVDTLIAAGTAAISKGKGVIYTGVTNSGGAYIGSSIKGEEKLPAVIGAALGSLAGSSAEKGITNALKPIKNQKVSELIGQFGGNIIGEAVSDKTQNKLKE